jgi:hypothetical protein
MDSPGNRTTAQLRSMCLSQARETWPHFSSRISEFPSTSNSYLPLTIPILSENIYCSDIPPSSPL